VGVDRQTSVARHGRQINGGKNQKIRLLSKLTKAPRKDSREVELSTVNFTRFNQGGKRNAKGGEEKKQTCDKTSKKMLRHSVNDNRLHEKPSENTLQIGKKVG